MERERWCSATEHRLSLQPAILWFLFVVFCALILAWQLLFPEFIGMANNGDFGKVAGPLCIADADNGADNFVYFRADYLRDPKYCYHPHILSSEIVLAWVASLLQQSVGDRTRFDIRWLGAIHALIFVGFYCALLGCFKRLNICGKIILSFAALWIVADAGIIAYFNSFYSDTAALLGGLTAMVLVVHLTRQDRARAGLLFLFGLSAALFIMSKGQHAVIGLVPAAAFAGIIAWRNEQKSIRVVGCTLATALVVGTIWVLTSIPDWYRDQARFSLIFFSLVKHSNTPLRDLRELGLADTDLRYVGMHAFMNNSPLHDAMWRRNFDVKASYSNVLQFYFRHPERALAKLNSDLRNQAWERRPGNLSNVQRKVNHPPGARTERLGTWSTLRSRLFHLWPYHILVWYGLILLGSPVVAARETSRFRRSILWTNLGTALLGAAEFCIVSLADAVETYRHLLMFHVFTDLTMFLVLLFLVSSRMSPQGDGNAEVVAGPEPG